MLNNPATPVASLPINRKTVFVDINTLRISHGIRGDKVKEFVESGDLLWVFDLGQHSLRNLRFWLPEILNPAAVTNLKLEEVISKILPVSRPTINGSEIGHWFLVDRSTVKQIGAKCRGTVTNKRFLTVPRDSLAGYLRRRWIGAGKAAKA